MLTIQDQTIHFIILIGKFVLDSKCYTHFSTNQLYPTYKMQNLHSIQHMWIEKLFNNKRMINEQWLEFRGDFCDIFIHTKWHRSLHWNITISKSMQNILHIRPSPNKVLHQWRRIDWEKRLRPLTSPFSLPFHTTSSHFSFRCFLSEQDLSV